MPFHDALIILANAGRLDWALPWREPILVLSLLLISILAAPLLLRRLRLPGIAGLILAGVAFGPHGFQLLEYDAVIELLGTIGLLYIMFLAGLELDLVEYRRFRHRSVLFGILTFAVPLALGFPFCYFLLGLSLPGSLLVAGMFSTHTLVAYPIAGRLGIIKNEVVAVAVGGTILTDTAVLLLLTIVTASASGADPWFWGKLILSLGLFTATVIFLFPVVSRWFFRTFPGESSSQFLFVLALVFLAALLAKAAGLEPIIGAFLCGLAINPLIPHASPLMNRLEFFGNTLFIPVFLFSVGMLVDLGIAFRGTETLLVAAGLTAMALAAKWIAAWATQHLAGYSAAQRQLLFGLSSAHAAATLAVILVGFRLEFFGETVLNGVIILILLTCLVASFVTEAAGKKIVRQDSLQLPARIAPTLRVLVPIANPATIETLLDLATLIQPPHASVPTVVLSVVTEGPQAEEKLAAGRRMLARAAGHGTASNHPLDLHIRLDTEPAGGIVRSAREMNAQVIIIGWKGELARTTLLFGNALDKILERSDQMVMVSRIIHPVNLFRQVVVAVPGEAERESGFPLWVEAIYHLCQKLGAVWHLFCNEATVAACRQQLQARRATAPLLHWHPAAGWEEFFDFAAKGKSSDLFLTVSARPGTLSFSQALALLPHRLVDQLPHLSYVIIYPRQEREDVEATFTDQTFSL